MVVLRKGIRAGMSTLQRCGSLLVFYYGKHTTFRVFLQVETQNNTAVQRGCNHERAPPREGYTRCSDREMIKRNRPSGMSGLPGNRDGHGRQPETAVCFFLKAPDSDLASWFMI